MNLNKYNENRYRQKKNRYRITLGIEQMMNYPVINSIWIIIGIAIMLLIKVKQLLVSAFDVPQFLVPMYRGCMDFSVSIVSIAIVIGIFQMIGELTARKDEADIALVFDKADLKIHGNPILISKRKLKNKNIILREFYSTISMNEWEKKRETISDVMNIHFIGKIDYGGKSNGNIIQFKSAKGEKQKIEVPYMMNLSNILVGYDYDAWYGYGEKKKILIDVSPKVNSHILVSGISGSGKSWFIEQLIARIFAQNTLGEVFFADYKQDDTFEFLRMLPRYYAYESCIDALETVYKILHKRQSGEDKTRNPITLVWDEYFSFILALQGTDKKKAEGVMKNIRNSNARSLFVCEIGNCLPAS